MIVLIDGYNLLRQVFAGVKGTLDAQRSQFISELGYYFAQKHEDLQEVILVFDAGPFLHASREVKNGISVIFSGQKSSADDWIINYARKHREHKIVVVSRDRKMLDECIKFGAQQVDSLEFYNMVQDVIVAGAFGAQDLVKKGELEQLKKYEKADTDWLYDEQSAADRKAVDLLMSQASLQNDHKNFIPDELIEAGREKGNPRKLSKKDRELNKVLKKLR